jgi:hypothetical protein
MHICIVSVGHGSFNHNHFEGEITLLEMHEQHLQKGMFMKGQIFCIESKSKRGYENGDMHVVITIELTTIVSLIPKC